MTQQQSTIRTRQALVDVPVEPIRDEHAERLLIAGCLTDWHLADELLLSLAPAALTDATCANIADGIRALRVNNLPVDSVSVWRELRKAGREIALDVIQSLARLDHGAAVTRHHASIVRSCYVLRALVELNSTVTRDAWLPGADAEQLLARAQSELLRLTEQAQSGDRHVVTLAESADESEREMLSGIAPGISTGYHDLDALLGGWHPGDLVVIAARPGVGKTAAALSFAVEVAKQRMPVFIVSMEMSHTDLTKRMLARASGIDGQAIRLHSVQAHDAQKLARGFDTLRQYDISLYDKAAVSLADVRARAHTWRRSFSGDGLIIVDYLQLMKTQQRSGVSRATEVGELSSGLKQLARELDVPIIALAQLNRAVENRASHIPMLSDLRESGNIEQDSDLIMFLYREELYDRYTDKRGVIELHIAKHRNGPVGVVPLAYRAETMSIEELSQYRSIEGYDE